MTIAEAKQIDERTAIEMVHAWMGRKEFEAKLFSLELWTPLSKELQNKRSRVPAEQAIGMYIEQARQRQQLTRES